MAFLFSVRVEVGFIWKIKALHDRKLNMEMKNGLEGSDGSM
jgi:hypothetical protein